ncbi:MAG: GAF domain-containing protein, partial [Deltaproteobacteria bacterium]|nr:GAF domain-containing protein [Deltaproteobacteria bacterium]
MKLGYVLLREQLFFRRELKERVFWFIKLRWLAVFVALAGTWVAHFLGLSLPVQKLTIIALFILLYNIVFLYAGRKFDTTATHETKPFTIFAHTQISLDLVALFLMIYFTGGVTSPLLIFTIFHIILAGILLTPAACYFYAFVVLTVLGGLILAQNYDLLAFQPILFNKDLLFLFLYGRGLTGLSVLYLSFVIAILISAFLITSVKITLRTKGRELLQLSHELDSSNAKLTALYDMVREIGLKSDLQNLMDSATRHATKVMGVKGCSIKLLDERKKNLKFGSTYGLSEDYLSKGTINIKKSPINYKILQGSPYVIGCIEEKDYFQFPEDIRKEGIASMLCLPLRVEKMVLGIFCVYSSESYHFVDGDVEFFSLVTELTALAMENLQGELTKSWFMIKAAHQIRSPLNAIYSMLNLLYNQYLGPIDEKQREIIERCEKRINILGELINDLLKLGEKRSEAASTELYLVDPYKTINNLIPLYQNQALEKGLVMEFDIQEPLPKIMADEGFLDDLVSNLISNAIKYTPQNGKVHVSLAKESDEWVKLEVSDTGIGISEEEISRLFSEFFRG